jgi:hypothetical protein
MVREQEGATMTSHEFLFGDKFDRAVIYIAHEAIKAGTVDAYKTAIERLAGLRVMLIFLASEGGPPFTTALIMLQNVSLKLSKFAEGGAR